MKKYMLMIALAALAAGTAIAQDDGPDSNNRKGKAWDREGGKPGWGQMDKRGGPPEGAVDPETMKQMKAAHEEIRDLAGAARIETDEAKKAEIVARLRTKLGEVADLMQAKHEQRLAQAEERLAGLKAKMEEAKGNRDALIEEQVQRVLKGEKPQRPERFKDFPNAKHGGRPAGGPDGEEPPPPPLGEDMPEDMPAE